MTKKLFLLISTVFWFICIAVSAEPHDDFVCQTLSVPGGEEAALSGGLYKPSSNQPGEYFRTLFIFVQFEGDTRADAAWPLDSLPVWAYDFIDSSPSSNYRNITFSDYWADMSMDNFDFIGDVYPELVILPSENYYSQNGKNYSHCNLDVLAAIDENVDFSRYDNWKLESGQFVFSSSDADNLVDMIYIIYRNPDEWFGNFTAIAHLGFSNNFITNDTTQSGNIVEIRGLFGSRGSGITVRQGLRGHYDLIERCAHEYGHYLFGAGHSNYTGIMGGETYALSGWERIELGYVTPIIPTTDGETAILGDFIKDGDIVKIPVLYWFSVKWNFELFK